MRPFRIKLLFQLCCGRNRLPRQSGDRSIACTLARSLRTDATLIFDPNSKMTSARVPCTESHNSAYRGADLIRDERRVPCLRSSTTVLHRVGTIFPPILCGQCDVGCEGMLLWNQHVWVRYGVSHTGWRVIRCRRQRARCERRHCSDKNSSRDLSTKFPYQIFFPIREFNR